MAEKNEKSNLYNASASLMGYLYQCRVALLESIKRLPMGIEFIIKIEILDDVSFEKEGSPAELLQTKHHVNQVGNLTNAAPDIWKTIRIWCEGILSEDIKITSKLYLITNATADETTIAGMLKSTSRNINGALNIMNNISSTSSNATNEAAYKVFRSLSHQQKLQLLDSIIVVDSYSGIDNIEKDIKDELFHAVDKKYLDQLFVRLEGWWYGRIICMFTKTQFKPILSEELMAQIKDLRNQLRDDNLPIDDDVFDMKIEDCKDYEEAPFVSQLKLIGINNKRIVHAVRNYYRAFYQRSRWYKDKLLLIGELSKYEDRLFEEWEVRYLQMVDECGEVEAEDAKIKAAQQLYKWAEVESLPTIRNVEQPFISRGSLHMLANELKIGWHPDFKKLLEKVLGVGELCD